MDGEHTEIKTATLQEHQAALYQLLTAFDAVCRQHGIPYVLFAGSMLGAVRHQGFIPWDDDLDVMLLREDYERFLQVAPQSLDSEQFFLQKEFSQHWPMFFSKLRFNHTACLEKYHPRDPQSHQGVYIDIFPCDNASDSRLVRRLQFYSSKVVIAKSLDRRGYETDSRKKKIFMALCRLLPMRPFLRLVQLRGKNTAQVHSFFGASSRYDRSVYDRSFFENRTLMRFEAGQFPVPADYDRLLTVLYGDYMKLPEASERTCKKHAILVDLNRSYEDYAHYRDGMVFDEYTRSIR